MFRARGPETGQVKTGQRVAGLLPVPEVLMLAVLLLILLQPAAHAENIRYAPVTGHITSSFGWRSDPMHGGRRFHSGVDIGASHGSPIYATQAGQVVYSGRYKGYGNVVVVYHGSRLFTLYGHTARNYVKKGDNVRRGQVIAAVGSTGRSTGPHLHFEVHQNKQYVDPLRYLNYISRAPNLDVTSVEKAPRLARAQAPALRRVEPDGVTYLRNRHAGSGGGVQLIQGNNVRTVSF